MMKTRPVGKWVVEFFDDSVKGWYPSEGMPPNYFVTFEAAVNVLRSMRHYVTVSEIRYRLRNVETQEIVNGGIVVFD